MGLYGCDSECSRVNDSNLRLAWSVPMSKVLEVETKTYRYPTVAYRYHLSMTAGCCGWAVLQLIFFSSLAGSQAWRQLTRLECQAFSLVTTGGGPFCFAPHTVPRKFLELQLIPAYFFSSRGASCPVESSCRATPTNASPNRDGNNGCHRELCDQAGGYYSSY